MFQCCVPGCSKNANDGYAIYRTSPKGEPFEGMCGEHRPGTFDEPDVAGMIEQESRKEPHP